MSTPSILGYLTHQIVSPVAKKGLFSGEYLLFADYLSIAQRLYETGAVLGFSYRDRLDSFAALLSEPGRQADLASFLMTSNSAADRLAGLPDDPKNFYDLFLKPEGKKLMKNMHDVGLTQFSDWQDFPKVRRIKMPIKKYFEILQFTVMQGILLGSRHPELTEKLFSYEYDAEEWRVWYEAGSEIGPSPPKTIPLRERQTEVAAVIRPYVANMRPELLAKLGL